MQMMKQYKLILTHTLSIIADNGTIQADFETYLVFFADNQNYKLLLKHTLSITADDDTR